MKFNINNPWHKVNIGENAPEIVNGIIEMPKNSWAKYKLDKDSGLLIMDSSVFSTMRSPANYGFIPQTYCDDNGPLDILIYSQTSVMPMCIVPSKVAGVMTILDEGKLDNKILATAQNDMSVNHIDDISKLPKHFFEELKHFFEGSKKTVKVDSFQNAEIAKKIIIKSIEDYKKLMKSKSNNK